MTLTRTSSPAARPRSTVCLGPGPRSHPESGFSLTETALALTLLTLISLSANFAILRSTEAQSRSFDNVLATFALRDKVAEIQEIANLPQDLSLGLGIGAVYSRFHGTTSAATQLPSGSVVVTCFGNEATVPAEFGGPQDLNLDGDASDDLANQSNGTDLKIVPLRLVVSYDGGEYVHSMTLHRLVTKTTN